MNIDKNCVRQVLGCLAQSPDLLSQTDKYILTLEDFKRPLEKYIFAAIQGLHVDGARNITAIDVENYLSTNSTAKLTFEQQKGIEYLTDSIEYSDKDNFSYYYTKLKKMNLLYALEKQGMDISEFYSEDLLNPKSLEINKHFEELTIQNILDVMKKKLLGIEHNFLKNDVTEVESVADNLDDFLENIVEDYDVGLPLQGEIFNEILSGAQLGTLTIRSMPSGVGKTRQAVGDACLLAYPIRFDVSAGEWVQVGSNEKVLFIATEQNFKEIKKMILAYLTGINENRFKYANYSEEEILRIKQAAALIKKFKNNFYIVRMPNPTIELVKNIIRENCLTLDIKYVFYDYIFIGPALLNEFKGFNLRDDEILLMFATALKDVAVEQQIFVMTATQVNSKVDDNKNIRNESAMAGGRATINKADNGLICNRPTSEELEIIKDFSLKYGEPNIVSDIFKVRDGEWTQVRIWSRVDLGIMRKKDLFLTDARLCTVPAFEEREAIEIRNWEDEENNPIWLEQIERMNNELSKIN